MRDRKEEDQREGDRKDATIEQNDWPRCVRSIDNHYIT